MSGEPFDHRGVLRTHLWPERRQLVVLISALAVGTALPLVGPILIGLFVDKALNGEPTPQLIVIASIYLVAAIAGQGTTVLTTWLASRNAWSTTNRLREELTEHALSLDLDFFGDHAPGELIERVDGDVHTLAEFFVTFLVDILGSALLLAGTLVVLAFADTRLAAVLGVYIILAALVLVPVQHRSIPTGIAAREADANLFSDLEEHLAAAEDLHTNGAGPHVVNRIFESSAEVYRTDQRAETVGGGLVRLTSLAFTIGTVLVLSIGIALLRNGAVTVGTTVLLFQYTQLVRRPLERIIDQLKQLQQAQAGTARAAELLERRPVLPRAEPDDATTLPPGPLAAELRGVTFAYEADDPVLYDVDLVVPAGSRLGLIGRSGAGKTTMARLLVRLHDPTDGAVLLGGVDLREVGVADLRSRTAVVTQDVQLFPASVRDNLTLFRPSPIDDAALTAQLADLGLGPWLAGLPAGLDTELSATVGLSAGESQLLALARAFLTDPGLVVLDEPSSRLDAATEALVERAIEQLLEGRTAVVIAHRLASLDRVDHVAVVDAGRIIEYGARDALADDPASRFGALLVASTAGRPR